MADSGTFKHWSDGLPAGTVEVVANKSGSFKHWSNGLPDGVEYAAAGGGGFQAAWVPRRTKIIGMGI
jgi:hypothetical protein